MPYVLSVFHYPPNLRRNLAKHSAYIQRHLPPTKPLNPRAKPRKWPDQPCLCSAATAASSLSSSSSLPLPAETPPVTLTILPNASRRTTPAAASASATPSTSPAPARCSRSTASLTAGTRGWPTCDGGTPVLLLDRDNYTVSGINYTTLAVSLVDADVATGSCPMVDHNVTVLPAARLFFPTSTTAYLFFFLGCAVGPGADGDPKPITCGGADERTRKSFVLPEDAVPLKDWYNVCQAVYRAPARRDALPADAHDPKWRDGGYVKTLREGFLVTWGRSSGSGECSRCEQSTGKCGFNRTGRFLGCLCADGRVESVGCSTISDSAAPPLGKPS